MARALDIGRRVIDEEAAALTTLAERLGAGFEESVEAILAVRGRVVVSGIGKSGHIARKIAATLASTGTPAQFVHPAEASHGDLGMVSRADLVLAISNSGEAPELANLIAYSRRFSIPLVAISARPDSSLMRAADIGLVLPALGEACGHGIVPTISTTMTLALGDALAVALMERRAFTAEDFRDIHPGGRLGARLTRVEALMHADMPLVTDETPMGEALVAISAKGFGVVGVTDADGALIGIVTDGDLRRHMDGLMERTAVEVMTPAPQTIAPDALAEEAMARMQSRKITCLFVMRPGESRPVGLIHIHDCLRAGLA